MNFSDIFLTNGTLSPVLIIWLMYIAIVIGTILYFTINYKLGKIVTTLLEKDAVAPESALSLEEMGIKHGFLTKMCLKSYQNYKNLLVAITSDGKFYANMTYTDTAPVFKELSVIKRKRKSRVTAKETDSTASEPINEEIISPAPDMQRPNFDPAAAKYYIPREVHAKANGLFKTNKTNVFIIIGAIIALGVVVYFAGFLLDSVLSFFR